MRKNKDEDDGMQDLIAKALKAKVIQILFK
jgi:hypothetical protein